MHQCCVITYFSLAWSRRQCSLVKGMLDTKAPMSKFYRVLLERDWNWEFAYRSPKECFIVLKNIILALTNIYIPIKQNKSLSP